MLVKKYSNRRLYDTEGSCYITLEELAERIRRGAEPRVVDAKTNEDLTQATLTQIIIEGRGAARLLPVPLLTQLIRMGDDALAEFLGRYMSTALELYLQAKQGAQAIAPYNPLASVPFAATSALARLLVGGLPFGWGEPAAPPAPPPPAPSPSPSPPAASDVADLRRELEELKRSLKAEAPPPAAKRRRK
jgi:polyhydroxyalkanoate synthesis repressor PhaR